MLRIFALPVCATPRARRAHHGRIDLPKLARVLGVSVEEILGDANAPVAHRAGPVGQVQKIFEEVRRLPRRQQQKVIDVVAALLEQYRKQAS